MYYIENMISKRWKKHAVHFIVLLFILTIRPSSSQINDGKMLFVFVPYYLDIVRSIVSSRLFFV